MKIKILLVSLLTFCQVLIAQEGIPLYQDYLTSSWYLIHPATAGASNVNQIRLTGRTQWLDVDDAPSLITASINGRVSKKVGLGFIAFNDENGNFSENGFYGTFAYHLNLSARETELHQVSFGFSWGFLQNKIDDSSFSATSVALDPAVFGTSRSDTFTNVEFGVSYFKQDFFAHLSVKNAIPISKNQFITINDLEPDNQRRFIFTTGHTFSINKAAEFSLEPSLQYANTPEISEQLFDINVKAYKGLEDNNTIWGGIAYRNAVEGTEFTLDDLSSTDINIQTQNYQTLSGFVGLDYKEFVFAYTFTSQLDQVTISNSGFHQITLGYNFGRNSNARSGSKRWDCNCPASNY